MENLNGIPNLLKSVPLEGILRIDVALEGDWSQTVATVWSREAGHMGFSKVIKSHPTFKPSLELYFQAFWLGVHCFTRTKDVNVFDNNFASQIINYVESNFR